MLGPSRRALGLPGGALGPPVRGLVALALSRLGAVVGLPWTVLVPAWGGFAVLGPHWSPLVLFWPLVPEVLCAESLCSACLCDARAPVAWPCAASERGRSAAAMTASCVSEHGRGWRPAWWSHGMMVVCSRAAFAHLRHSSANVSARSTYIVLAEILCFWAPKRGFLGPPSPQRRCRRTVMLGKARVPGEA